MHDWVLAVVFLVVAAGFDSYGAYAVRRRAVEAGVEGQVVRITQRAITITSPLARTDLEWKAIGEIVEVPPLLVLERRRTPLVVLPLAS